MQVPSLLQIPPSTQRLGFSQGALVSTVWTHSPVSGLQLPAWHWSWSVQVRGVPPWQTPALQVPPSRQRSGFSQDVPFSTGERAQEPPLQMPVLH